MKKSFGVADWKDQLKKLARRVGVEAKQTIFLLKDSEIVSDQFLEDVNNLLNNGEVPNLFVNEEFKQLIEDVGVEARNSNTLKDNTRDSIYNFFVDRCKRHLHIVFCANPAGDAFRYVLFFSFVNFSRNRVRKFPALVNCCTVDLFFDWPSDALKAVAQSKLEDLGLSSMVFIYLFISL